MVAPSPSSPNRRTGLCRHKSLSRRKDPQIRRDSYGLVLSIAVRSCSPSSIEPRPRIVTSAGARKIQRFGRTNLKEFSLELRKRRADGSTQPSQQKLQHTIQ
eukprot:2191943-Prymnesium_polylepis.1